MATTGEAAPQTDETCDAVPGSAGIHLPAADNKIDIARLSNRGPSARCGQDAGAPRTPRAKTWLNRRNDGVSRNPAPEFSDVRRGDVTMTDMTRRMQRDPHIPTRAGRMLASRAPTRFAALAIMLSVWVSVTAQSAALPDDDYAALARAVIDQVVIPAWAGHARAAQGLAPAIERHCTGSAKADAAAVRAAFDGVMDAWQRASPPPRARGRSPRR